MKNIVVLIFLFFGIMAYSQQYQCDTENVIAVYEYTEKHFDEIKKGIATDFIYVELEFNNDGVLSGAKYYDSNDKEKEMGMEIQPNAAFDAYIKELFFFCPGAEMDKESGDMTGFVFRLPMVKKKLAKGIEEMTKEKECLKKESSSQLIQPDADFMVAVKNFVKPVKGSIPVRNVYGKLLGKESGIIKLTNTYSLYFKVVTTTDNGISKDYVFYRLFELKEGKAFLITKKDWVSISNNEAQFFDYDDELTASDVYITENRPKLAYHIVVLFNKKAP